MPPAASGKLKLGTHAPVRKLLGRRLTACILPLPSTLFSKSPRKVRPTLRLARSASSATCGQAHDSSMGNGQGYIADFLDIVGQYLWPDGSRRAGKLQAYPSASYYPQGAVTNTANFMPHCKACVTVGNLLSAARWYQRPTLVGMKHVPCGLDDAALTHLQLRTGCPCFKVGVHGACKV